MRSSRQTALLVLAGLLLAEPSEAMAQTYQPGISLDEARSIAASAGYDLVSAAGGYFERRLGPDGKFETSRAIGFCDNRLSSITANLNGGFAAFARILTDLENRVGRGVSSSRSEYGQYGLTSQVNVTFVDGRGTVHRASMSEIGTFGLSVAQTTDYSSTICRR